MAATHSKKVGTEAK